MRVALKTIRISMDNYPTGEDIIGNSMESVVRPTILTLVLCLAGTGFPLIDIVFLITWIV